MPSDGDPGDDGVGGFRTGTDAFAFALGYYEGDYKPINPNAVVSDSRDKLWDRYRETRDTTSAAGLYNGNISWMSTDLPGLGSNRMQAMVYGYDQLHRIVQARSLTEYGANGFEGRVDAARPYDVDYSYDPNGNLLTLQRRDSQTAVRDDLTYEYYDVSNKLKNVDGSVNENYQYDQIGNLISDAEEGIENIDWTPYGKVRKVEKADNSSVSFRYDASGNRIAKIASGDTTVYVRDASGNVMGVYKNDTLIEQSIYGSSRLGLMTSSSKTGYRTLGGKKYELSNHLGNVLAVVSDNINFDQDSTWANVVNVTDYYPFGLAMDGRTVQDSSYRYGLQGWEKDDEIAGFGKSYTTLFRQHDPRLGRTWSRDPKNQYASPYIMLGNRPVSGVDPDGAWFWEKSNVRQARQFARKTGGEFEKWKGDDGKRYAGVTLRSTMEGSGSVSGTEITLDRQNVDLYMFRPGQNRSDLLMDSGVGFHATMRATSSGTDQLHWMARSGDAWFEGTGEYDRNGQAPGAIKGLAGLNPLVSVPNAAKILMVGEDIYGQEANTKTDQIVAGLEISIGVVLPIAKPVIGTMKASKVIERANLTVQVINDLGGLDKLKKFEKDNE